MKPQPLFFWLLAICLAGLPTAAFAQSTTTDTVLRTNGEEVPGKVLTISPERIMYVPAATPTDTVSLPAAEVFLIRYANGTRELIHPLAPVDTVGRVLLGLSAPQRQARGRADARRSYTGRDTYWISFGVTSFTPIAGVALAATYSGSKVKNLDKTAPQPLLLHDPNYAAGYQQQASHIRSKKAWAGFGTSVGVQVVLVGIMAAIVSSGW